jgi:hypothetical protein
VKPIVWAYNEVAPARGDVRPEPERAASAAIVLGAAVIQHLGSLPDLEVKQIDLTRSENASREVAALAGETIMGVGVTSAGPTHACVKGPLPALTELAKSDALVLVYAVQVRHPGSGLAMLNPFTLALTPLILAVDPMIAGEMASGGSATLQVCVVDSRTAETLWSSTSSRVERCSRSPVESTKSWRP